MKAFTIYVQHYPTNVNLPMVFQEKEVIVAVDEVDAIQLAKRFYFAPAVQQYRSTRHEIQVHYLY